MKARIPNNPPLWIHPNSTVAETLSLYKLLDNIVDKSDTCNTCLDDCSDCCSDYFYISQKEFFTIVHYCFSTKKKDYLQQIIVSAKRQMKSFMNNHPEEYAKLNATWSGESDIYTRQATLQDSEFIKGRLREPCVFLNENKKCDIYPVRPYICRNYGTRCSDSGLFPQALCNKITKPNYLNLSQDEILGMSGLDKNAVGIMRPYPIIDWFSSVLPIYMAHPKAKLEPAWKNSQH